MALTLVFDVKSWQDLGRFCSTVKLVGLQKVKCRNPLGFKNKNKNQPGSVTDVSDSSAPVFQAPSSPPHFIPAHLKVHFCWRGNIQRLTFKGHKRPHKQLFLYIYIKRKTSVKEGGP